jgi:hypothetical protein
MRTLNKQFIIYLVLAVITGICIAWIDSRPNWDDTGITAGLIFSSAAIFGYLATRKPWLIALGVCVWIPLYGNLVSHNYGGFLALVPGFAGAYLGYAIKLMIFNH